MSACIGRIVDGKYVIRESIGRGGAGEIYLAEHVTLGSRVAVKFLRPETVNDREEVDRFVRNATTCARIVSDHVVKVVDLGQLPSGELFIVMEHLVGETLADRLVRDGRLFPSEVADLGIQVLAALDATHEAGIVHRNVSPRNIFYAARHEAERVKLLDFGVCRLLASSPQHATAEGAMHRASAYMAPEHVRGEAVDARADLYSLGVVLHEAAVGRLPYKATTTHELVAEVAACSPTVMESDSLFDPGLREIVTRALAPRPEDRFQNVEDVRNALLMWYADAPIASPSQLSTVRRRLDAKARSTGTR